MQTLTRVLKVVAALAVIRLLLFAVGEFVGPAGYVQGGPPPAVSVTATDPGLDNRLGDYQHLYVQLTYQTTQPVYLSLDGVAAGQVVRREMTGGMYRAEPGSGEAVLWIAFPAGTMLDALRVSVLDLRERPVSSSDLPAHLAWTTENVISSNPPDWVAREREQENRPAPFTPPGEWDVAAGMGLLYGVPLLYLILQVWFGMSWMGGWRKAALAPLLIAVPAVLWSAYAAADNSNLAFLPIALMTPLGLIYLLIIAALRFSESRAAS